MALEFLRGGIAAVVNVIGGFANQYPDSQLGGSPTPPALP
jgi:hypothetical protein